MSEATNQAELTRDLGAAVERAKAGALDEAIAQLERILAREPRHEVALGMLASIYLQIGMHERAVDRFGELLDVNPGNTLARFQMGMAELLMDHPERALEVWRPMLSMANEFMANFHSALALERLGRPEEAADRTAAARRHMPRSHPLRPELVKLHERLVERTAP